MWGSNAWRHDEAAVIFVRAGYTKKYRHRFIQLNHGSFTTSGIELRARSQTRTILRTCAHAAHLERNLLLLELFYQLAATRKKECMNAASGRARCNFTNCFFTAHLGSEFRFGWSPNGSFS